VKDALLALVDARPALHRVVSAREAIGLPPRTLLHAGPPLLDPAHPPAPLRSAIVATCLHEGWADDDADANALLDDGALVLQPAQPQGCVTPLVAVISSRTPLFEVREESGGMRRQFAPVSAVRGADARVGHRDASLLARLRQRDDEIAPALKRALRRAGPIALWPLAAQGLAQGDDLHSRTTAANDALAAQLRMRDEAALADHVAATPLFFLTLWMAAAALILRSAEGGDRPTLVTRGGGNGERFGIALASAPAHWICCDATPPQGPRLPHVAPTAEVLGAAGDSAVIDLLGLGGMRLAHAPEPMSTFAPFIAADALHVTTRLLLAPQPLLADGWPLGLDARDVVATGVSPIVMLAMLARDGGGLVGRGMWRPPLALFEQALSVIAFADGSADRSIDRR
jgi:hypothetical protein